MRGAQAAGQRWGDPALDPEVAAGRVPEGNPELPGARQSTGGATSPMLANTLWIMSWMNGLRRRQATHEGRCLLIRVADDFVIGCEREDDARRMLMVLPKRFALSSPFIRRRPAWCSSSRRVKRATASMGTARSTSRTDPLLGQITAGILGDQAAHGQDAAAASDAGGVALVPHASARTAAGPILAPAGCAGTTSTMVFAGTTGSWKRSIGMWSARGGIG